MHEHVFEAIDSDQLRAYAVWEPILVTDNERSARKARAILADPRVRHYWVAGHEVGEMFQPALGLTEETAWDVYLVYPPGVEWSGDSPPRPTYFMHQLRTLPEDRQLDAAVLASRIQDALAHQEGVLVAPRIQLITFEGCPNTDATRAVVRQALSKMKVAAVIEEIDALDPKTPEPLREWGSPTVLINGEDIAGSPPTGRSCRLYADDQGRPSGTPTEALVSAALRRALTSATGSSPS